MEFKKAINHENWSFMTRTIDWMVIKVLLGLAIHQLRRGILLSFDIQVSKRGIFPGGGGGYSPENFFHTWDGGVAKKRGGGCKK